MKLAFRPFVLLTVVFGAVIVASGAVSADHGWGPPYHWARTSNPFSLKLGDNVSFTWDSYFNTTITDWSASSVLDLTKVTGGSNPKNCRPTSGRVEVCSSKYGNNGWLGLAQIWITGGEHIAQAVAKMNDTYFNTAKYNTSAWRNLVMCQEVGHAFGLDHQDENSNNANLGSCMDYTSNPESNQHPNQHDYDQLEDIYAHLDISTTITQEAPRGNGNQNLDDPSAWGRIVRNGGDGRPSLYERDFGGGKKVFTFVIWAQ